jgi:Ca2+-binding EF-hand superfamily protein
MKRKLIIGSLIAALAVPAITAVAKDGPSKGHHGAKMFERLDTNKDGEISFEEMTVKSSERFEKLDKDGNGTISVEEMTVRKKEFFDKLDADGSGTISQEEAKAFREKKGERKKERHATRIMERFDADKDGKISREEYQSVVMERFDNADTDGTGFITIDQVQDLRGKMKKKQDG